MAAWSCVVIAALVSGAYAIRANTWAVMTDELQVARLATSIVDELSLVPTIHGAYYGAHSQLYPLLLAPLYGTLAPPEAATVAHGLNALLLASAAVPAFFLARGVSGSVGAGYVAAALTAVTPWLALSSTLLTENVAYAAFAWSVLLCHRALVRPSGGRDLAALAGLGLAFVARTQLVVVALALPVALVLHEVGLAAREDGHRTVRSGVTRAVAAHRALALAYAVGAAVAGLLAVSGRLGGVVGNYVVPFEGDLLPDGFWGSAAAHFDQVALGVGVLPVVLSASWLVTTALRPERREAHAFAALLGVLVPLLLFEVTSFDLRFTAQQFIQDRYLVYLVPLFAVGCAAWLTMRGQLRTRLVSAACAGGAVVGLLPFASDEDRIIFWAAPAGAFRPAISDASARLHLADTVLLALATATALLVVLVLAWRAPRLALVGTASLLVAFGALQALYVLERFVEPSMVRTETARRDWIDAAVPGSSVALVPGGVQGPVRWWEAEFWNRTVDRELRVDGGKTYTPFPVLDVSIDDRRGRLAGPQPSDYLVLASDEIRFGLAASTAVAHTRSLRLRAVEPPYRLLWVTRGLATDGWLLPGKRATVRLFGHSSPGRRAVSVTLASSRLASSRIPFAITAEGATTRGTVDPGGARPPVDVTVCVPAGGSVDVGLFSPGRVRLENGRAVALHVERIAVTAPWPCAAN
ncbi:MAG TPA: glycosyltransferase family 39 protein [Gaiellaceae bacterium]|nr:glycosyltransferase family 39 protein [Gaiellaceae bacterium]